MLLSCGQHRTEALLPAATTMNTSGNSDIVYNGIQYRVMAIQQCPYPEKDPVVEKKQGKKLLLFCIEVYRTNVSSTAEIPTGALLEDNRGNSYDNLPGVIAMAQTNGCIKGDDIKAYNSIWNGTLQPREKQTAYVLGFEVPADAIPEKLYWNNHWKNKNIFFSIQL
jgi:hypothetical protein